MNRKSLLWFLIITFGIAWVLFTVPVAFKNEPTTYALSMQLCFMLAMWAPGIGAIATTVFVEKQPFRSLRLNTLGPKRFYLVAWFLPPLLTIATLGITLLLRTGTFDPNLTLMREALAQAPTTVDLPPVELLVAIQLAFGLLIAPFINVLFALGEELGWRGFLLPKLMPLGQWQAILISGAIWGFWHAPTTLLHGYNFPQHPYLGVLVMTVGCILLGTIISWLYLNTRSPWVAALAHGAFNASPGLVLYFLKPGFDAALGGSALGLAGWIPMALFIAWLVATKRLPVTMKEDAAAA
ncbi:MAG: CPBP family intramembrane glutamic endopeptidase [Chloroflexota bacterium]